MSELQNDNYEVDEGIVDEVEVENQDDGSDLATDSEAEHEENQQVDEEAAKKAAKDEAVQKAINEKVFKQRQAERRAEEAERKLAEIEREKREEQAKSIKSVPPMPDPFDDDFDVKVAERDRIIEAKARYDLDLQREQQETYNRTQREQQKRFDDAQEKQREYIKRSTDLGISSEDLQVAGAKVAQYGLSDDLVLHILSDKDGPILTQYLAANPQDGYDLALMSPYSQGVYLNEIKTKAAALKPKKTNAPKPATNLHGNGVDKDLGRYPNVKGAKFE